MFKEFLSATGSYFEALVLVVLVFSFLLFVVCGYEKNASAVRNFVSFVLYLGLVAIGTLFLILFGGWMVGLGLSMAFGSFLVGFVSGRKKAWIRECARDWGPCTMKRLNADSPTLTPASDSFGRTKARSSENPDRPGDNRLRRDTSAGRPPSRSLFNTVSPAPRPETASAQRLAKFAFLASTGTNFIV